MAISAESITRRILRATSTWQMGRRSILSHWRADTTLTLNASTAGQCEPAEP